MKFGQLIERSVWNNFLRKSNTKCDGETSLRPLKKIKIEQISGSIV